MGHLTELVLFLSTTGPHYVVTNDGVQHALELPGSDMEGIHVAAGVDTDDCPAHLTLDFDARSSIFVRPDGSGTYDLRPVIRLREFEHDEACEEPCTEGGGRFRNHPHPESHERGRHVEKPWVICGRSQFQKKPGGESQSRVGHHAQQGRYACPRQNSGDRIGCQIGNAYGGNGQAEHQWANRSQQARNACPRNACPFDGQA